MINEVKSPEWPVVGTVVISQEDWFEALSPEGRIALIKARVHDLQMTLINYLEPRLR